MDGRNLILSVCILLVTMSPGLAQNIGNSLGNNTAAGKYYKIRGFEMYTEVYGSGRPLLMIHGNNGSMSAFNNNITYFAQKYKVILADSRAQGKSADRNDSLSFEQMADDFSALLDTMRIDSAYVVGFSDGGINALLLAMRHPEKVIKLASTGANLWPDSTAITPAVWKNDLKAFNRLNGVTLKSNKEINDRKIFLLDWLQPNVPLSALKAIKCPSLIICGDHDVICLEHTLNIYRSISHAYLWILPNSGHSTLIEHSYNFNNEIDNFFKMPFINRK